MVYLELASDYIYTDESIPCTNFHVHALPLECTLCARLTVYAICEGLRHNGKILFKHEVTTCMLFSLLIGLSNSHRNIKASKKANVSFFLSLLLTVVGSIWSLNFDFQFDIVSCKL